VQESLGRIVKQSDNPKFLVTVPDRVLAVNVMSSIDRDFARSCASHIYDNVRDKSLSPFCRHVAYRAYLPRAWCQTHVSHESRHAVRVLHPHLFPFISLLLFVGSVSEKSTFCLQRLSIPTPCTRHLQIRSHAQDCTASRKCPRADPHIH
jgi:hypothetical protein